MSKRRPDIIARGPETIPRRGWQLQAYLQGRRFFETVLEGQYFPEGANQKRLDALARRRGDELRCEAAAQATAEVAKLELPEQEPEPEMPAVSEAA